MTSYEITGLDGKTYTAYTHDNAVRVAELYQAVEVYRVTRTRVYLTPTPSPALDMVQVAKDVLGVTS